MPHGSTGDHAFCSTLDDLSDHAQPNVSVPVLKQVALPFAFELAPILSPKPPTRHAWLSPAIAGPTVSVNLRHCVLLI
jgi:hypothetical protein